MKRLYKSETDKMICGVCGGLADYFEVDPTLIRIALVLLVLLPVGCGIVAYIIAAIVMPTESRVRAAETRHDG